VRCISHAMLRELRWWRFRRRAFGASSAYAADDGSVGSALLGAFGINTSNSNEKIDYRERAKVVVPPNRQALPERAGGGFPPQLLACGSGNARRSGQGSPIAARPAGTNRPRKSDSAAERLSPSDPGSVEVQETEAKAKGAGRSIRSKSPSAWSVTSLREARRRWAPTQGIYA